MAFRSFGLEDFSRELEELGQVDLYAEELLSAAAPKLENELKHQVSMAANKGYSTGQLEESLKAGKPGKNKKGHYVAVTAKGKDKKGIRNNEKLAYLNYGTSKQEAVPVLARTVRKAEKACVEAMQQKLEEVTSR